jgi:hypothetical protein
MNAWLRVCFSWEVKIRGFVMVCMHAESQERRTVPVAEALALDAMSKEVEVEAWPALRGVPSMKCSKAAWLT